MKRRVLVQVDEGTHVAWKERAFSQGRSMSDIARELIERAVLTERAGGSGSAGSDPETSGVPQRGTAVPSEPLVRSVSPADVAATIEGVQIGSSVCGVSPPGRNRPSCSLAAKHDGRHSWEAGV